VLATSPKFTSQRANGGMGHEPNDETFFGMLRN
jgi:hypothetical protein